jgi:RHS repeat-associated protein
VTAFYLYSGSTLIAELDSSGNITRSYSWGPLGPISDTLAGASRFYLFDGMGNTRFLLNAAGTVVGDAAYAAWGAVYGGSALPTPFAWKAVGGAYTDADSGLALMGARYYAPAIGRFLSRDPSGFAGGPNVYGFCSGDPIDFYDPDGCGDTNLPWEDEGKFWGAIRWTSDFFGDSADPDTFHTSRGYTITIPKQKSLFGTLIDAHDAAFQAGLVEGNTKASPQQVLAARWAFGRSFGAAAVHCFCVASCAVPSEPGSTGGPVVLYARSRVPVDNVTWPGTMSVDEAPGEGIDWVGPGYSEPGGRTGIPSGGVFRSQDGLRQFRMQDSDILGQHGEIGPHVHFQTYNRFGEPIENIHVPIR